MCVIKVPIILIGFAALGGATIPPVMSAWIAVFILPLNSAINPVIYTMSAIQCGKYEKIEHVSDLFDSMSIICRKSRHSRQSSYARSTSMSMASGSNVTSFREKSKPNNG